MATAQKRGEKWYMVWKNAAGKWVREVGFFDHDETLRAAQSREDEARKIRMGYIDPHAESRRIERARPVEEHIAAFETFMRSKKRTANHVQYTIADIRKCFAHAGVRSAAGLLLSHADAWRTHCVEVGYPDYRYPKDGPKTDAHKTANRRVASVAQFLRFLVQRGAMDRCILDRYEPLPTAGHERRVRRALDAEEVATLLEKCPDDERRDIYRFILLSGLRNREVRHMTPAHFDLKKMLIHIPALVAKSKKDQSVPIHPELVPMLKRRAKDRLPTVKMFHMECKNDLVRILHEDCAVAGVDTQGVDIHALRHTFCTRLAENNVRPDVLHKLSRHKNIQTTLKYYIHTKSQDERSAIALLSA